MYEEFSDDCCCLEDCGMYVGWPTPIHSMEEGQRKEYVGVIPYLVRWTSLHANSRRSTSVNKSDNMPA